MCLAGGLGLAAAIPAADAFMDLFGQDWEVHCLDLAKVQTQQGRLFFLILAVGCEWRVLVAQVTCGCRVLVAAVTQPTWQEITRHRLGSGAQLEKLKLNF
jgi:hypothetical protein